MLNVTNVFSNTALKEGFYSYKFLNLGGEEFYVNGFIKVLKFSSQDIVLKIRNGEILTLQGEQMYIKEICKQGILICGKVYKTGISK